MWMMETHVLPALSSLIRGFCSRKVALLCWTAGLVGCGSSSKEYSAYDIAYGDVTVAEAIQRLEASDNQVGEISDSEDGSGGLTVKRAQSLEERLARLELFLSELEHMGIIQAEAVGYDPRVTTLQATNLQDAMDQIEKRVSTLEEKMGQDMGSAGSGLYSMQGGSNGGGMGMTNQGGGMGGGMGGGGGSMSSSGGSSGSSGSSGSTTYSDGSTNIGSVGSSGSSDGSSGGSSGEPKKQVTRHVSAEQPGN